MKAIRTGREPGTSIPRYVMGLTKAELDALIAASVEMGLEPLGDSMTKNWRYMDHALRSGAFPYRDVLYYFLNNYEDRLHASVMVTRRVGLGKAEPTRLELADIVQLDNGDYYTSDEAGHLWNPQGSKADRQPKRALHARKQFDLILARLSPDQRQLYESNRLDSVVASPREIARMKEANERKHTESEEVIARLVRENEELRARLERLESILLQQEAI